MHRVGVTGHERMPPEEIALLMHEAACAGLRQPIEFGHVLRRPFDAIVYKLLSMGIIGTAAGAGVEQFARDVGEINLTGVFIFEPDKAALAAAIAQAFPLLLAHFGERLGFPEWRFALAGHQR